MIILTTCLITMCFLWGVLRKAVRDWGPSTPPRHPVVPPQPPSSREVVPRKTGNLCGNILDPDTKVNRGICTTELTVVPLRSSPQRSWEMEEREPWGCGGRCGRKIPQTYPIHSPFSLKTVHASQILWIWICFDVDVLWISQNGLSSPKMYALYLKPRVLI